jgi:protein-tyrosine phosphatase
MFLSFAPRVSRDDVPDPYYGGAKGFDAVLDLCEEAVQGLLEEIRPEVERRRRSAV